MRLCLHMMIRCSATCKNKCEIFLYDVDLLYISDVSKGNDDNVSKNTITLQMAGERDEYSATNVWPDYSIGVPT